MADEEERNLHKVRASFCESPLLDSPRSREYLDRMRESIDTLIVGAGLSGIGAAYHLQDQCPELGYAILEARAEMGGTWDLFRYPGIRSDSDMYTLGYSFRPWTEERTIAHGASILRYIKETAGALGIDRHIRLGHQVVSAQWVSSEARWIVDVEKTGSAQRIQFRCRFLLMCSGYYDYEGGYTPQFPGAERFKGTILHPQKWDESTNYDQKNIVVIGSGATAVTLVPEMAKRAKHVVMLQRTPSYVASLPAVDPVAQITRKLLPPKFAHGLIRWKNILIGMIFYRFCRRFPKLARTVLLRQVRSALGAGNAEMKNFTPSYAPWDQRVCFVPDGDLFESLKQGKAEVVTDTIDTFTENGIRLRSGRELPADFIVTATGLKLKFLGGIKLKVDRQDIDLTNVVPYKGAMLSGVPNLGMAFGYTNASWTLKCDLIGEWLGKVIRYMQDHGFDVVTPDANPSVKRVPLIDFSSGYFVRAKHLLPKQGTRSPWKLNQNYFSDLIAFRARPIADEGLRFN